MKRILSIDGGGIKGAFPAAFLAKLEEKLAAPIGRYFDLIAGTSTGGIIALALGAGYSAKDVLGFYEQYGPRIFANVGYWHRALHWIVGKHDPSPLRGALDAQFGARILGNSLTRLVVPAQNLETGEVYIFKTSHHPRFQEDWKLRMVEVAMATAAAPSYFPVHRLPNGAGLIDGGIWANDPAGVAAVEAVGVLKWDPMEVRLLSVSCTASPMSTSAAYRRSWGKAYWAQKMLEVVGAGQSSGAQGTAALLLGHERVVRIAPVVASGVFEIDGASAIDRLRGLGEAEARTARSYLAHLFDEPAEEFVPYDKQPASPGTVS